MTSGVGGGVGSGSGSGTTDMHGEHRAQGVEHTGRSVNMADLPEAVCEQKVRQAGKKHERYYPLVQPNQRLPVCIADFCAVDTL